MNFEAINWIHRAEILLVLVTLALLVLAPRLEKSPTATSLLGLVGAVGALACATQATDISRFALIVGGAVLVVALLLLRTAELFDARQRPEGGALILVGGIGAIVLAASDSLLEMAIGVELISLAGAALVGLGRGKRPLEAGFKYFLLTAVTFATLLFGMALVFVGTGSLAFPTATSAVAGLDLLVAAGVGLMLIGLAFKLAIVPVHFGALDAYTAGPASFVGFIMLASKLGAAIAMARIAAAMGAGVSSLMLGAGLVTIGFGVLASFAQTDLRRLLAYSAVTHAGFLAVAAGSPTGGAEAVRFYLVCYAASAGLAFAAVAGTGTQGFALSRLGPAAGNLGLGRVRSFALLIALLSLAGVPPLPGFWAKLAVLEASWHSWGMLATALTALGGVIGIIYYLRPMPDLLASTLGTEPEAGEKAGAAPVAIALVVVVVALGLVPGVAWWLAR